MFYKVGAALFVFFEGCAKTRVAIPIPGGAMQTPILGEPLLPEWEPPLLSGGARAFRPRDESVRQFLLRFSAGTSACALRDSARVQARG